MVDLLVIGGERVTAAEGNDVGGHRAEHRPRRWQRSPKPVRRTPSERSASRCEPSRRARGRGRALESAAACSRRRRSSSGNGWRTSHGSRPATAGSRSRPLEARSRSSRTSSSTGAARRTRSSARSIPDRPAGIDVTLREPVGVCVLITPWNFPLAIASWKIAPALACGNTAIVKPASQTPLTALALADILREAGLPDGDLQRAAGPGSTVAGALIADPRVSKIAFTGSTEVGTRVMKEAANNITRVSLELGGKSASVIFADADLDVCVEKSIWAVFDNAGQDCCARSRAFVERPIYDEFVERFAKRAESIAVGEPLDEATEMGPLISQGQRQTSLDYIELGIGEGARRVTGGDVPDSPGFYLRPAVLADVRNEMRVAQEEIFGPVASFIPFDTEEEAIRMANESPYGLSGSVWTQNLGCAIRVSKAIRAGVISVNSSSSVHTEAPFGGYKQSGIGREMGMHAAELYTELKNIFFSET